MMKDVNSNMNNLVVSEHKCANMKIDGCILQAETSNLEIIGSSFSSVLMQDRSIAFVLHSSTVILSKTSLKEMSGERSPCFLKAIQLNSLSIVECAFINFAKQAIQIENTSLNFTQNSVLLEDDFKSLNLFEEGFLVCKNCKNSVIQRSTFKGIRSSRGSALRIYSSKVSKDNNKILVANNVFTENFANQDGGAIHLIDENIELVKNEFSKNKATNGGAIYLNCSSEEDLCDWRIDSCSFIGNEAIESGGAIFWENSYPKGYDNSFSNNNAAHGSDRASKPMKIVLISENMDDLVSGQILEKYMDFNIVDAYNQVCSTLSKGQAFIQFNQYEDKPSYLQTIQGDKF
jgi:predicted outer membrane repeat protein